MSEEGTQKILVNKRHRHEREILEEVSDVDKGWQCSSIPSIGRPPLETFDAEKNGHSSQLRLV